MANICGTIYKIVGEEETLKSLNELLGKLLKDKKRYLHQLAESLGIDYECRLIHCRGYIDTIELNDEEGRLVLRIDVCSSWTPCTELFEAVNEYYGDKLSISWLAIESGCDLYWVHDEESFFPEECCVSSEGELFGDMYEEPFDTISDAIDYWCKKMGIDRNSNMSDEEYIKFIYKYEYEDDDTLYHIHKYTQC